MAGKLIIIEAGDGCGKETQAGMLYERLKREGRTVRKVQFPNYGSESSALIKMYLRGAFGTDPETVNPYAASAFYAVDRFASYKQEWEDFYLAGGIVIADRYTTSNMAHQAAKISDSAARDGYLAWLWDLEFVKFGLPVPDGVIFLDMPPAFSRELINHRTGQGRSRDIHEQDEHYLEKCYQGYAAMADKYAWNRVNCVSGSHIRSIEEIHGEVYLLAAKIIAGRTG
jgi:dTMP kinase